MSIAQCANCAALLEALEELRDAIYANQRAHDCPGFDCATCTPLDAINRADEAIAKAKGEA